MYLSSICIRRFVRYIIAFGIGLGLYGCNQGNTQNIKVAANLPLTGYFATYGSAVREGVQLAMDDIEQKNAKGIPVVFDWQDNAGDPKLAVSIFQKQYLTPPDIYISGVKPQSMAIMDQVIAKGTPHFVWIFDPFINVKAKTNLRTWVNYKIEPQVYLSYTKQVSAKKIAIVYVQLPHTLEEFNTLLIPELKKDSTVHLLVEEYTYGKKDFKDVAEKFKKFAPDLIILNGFQAELVGLVRALRPLKLISDGNTIATYDMLDAAQILGADEIEGIRQVAPIFVTRPNRDNVKKWRDNFKSKYNKEPLYTHAFAYDMALIINDAASRLKIPATSEQWLTALRTTSIEGVTGHLSFDSDGDLVTPLEVGVYRSGKLVPLHK